MPAGIAKQACCGHNNHGASRPSCEPVAIPNQQHQQIVPDTATEAPHYTAILQAAMHSATAITEQRDGTDAGLGGWMSQPESMPKVTTGTTGTAKVLLGRSHSSRPGLEEESLMSRGVGRTCMSPPWSTSTLCPGREYSTPSLPTLGTGSCRCVTFCNPKHSVTQNVNPGVAIITWYEQICQPTSGNLADTQMPTAEVGQLTDPQA